MLHCLNEKILKNKLFKTKYFELNMLQLFDECNTNERSIYDPSSILISGVAMY